MEQLFLMLVQKYPSAVMLFTAIGVLRAVFKPIMTVLESYVAATPSASDDEALKGFKASKAYAWIAWFIDYTASIKIAPQK